MKAYAVNIIRNNHATILIANNLKELRAIIKEINSKLPTELNKVEYLGLKKFDRKITTSHNPLEQIQLFLDNYEKYIIDTELTKNFYLNI